MTETGHRDYHFAGLRIRSFAPIAGWRELGDAEGEPDVEIRRGAVASVDLDGGAHASRVVSDGSALVIVVRSVARYRVSAGREILVDLDPDARPEDVQLYLTGAAMGAILHQRAVFPLHGSAVMVDGAAVVVTGPSRAGKSTLAAALSRRGYVLLTDDMAPLVRLADGRMAMWVGSARLKLDPRSLEIVQATMRGLAPVGGTRAKYELPVGRPGLDERIPLPLRRIYILTDAPGEPRIERLGVLDAVEAVGRDVYFPGFVVLLGREQQWFQLAAQVVSAVDVRRLSRPRGLEHLERVMDLLENDWKS